MATKNGPVGTDVQKEDEDIDFDALFESMNFGNEDDDDDEGEDDDFEFDEDDDDDDEEQEDDGYKKDPKYQKLLKDAQKEASDAVADAIANENTDSEVFKGLQRHLANRDAQIGELQQALTMLYNYMQQDAQRGSESSLKVDTLFESIEEMLDDDGKKVLNDRYKNKQENQKKESLENQVQRLTQIVNNQNNQSNQNQQQQNGNAEDDSGKAMEQLKDMVTKAGYDPDDDNIDYGSKEESILERMQKVNNSLDKVKSKKKKKKPTNTRTNPSSSGSDGSAFDGRDLLKRGAAKRTKEMRQMSRGKRR